MADASKSPAVISPKDALARELVWRGRAGVAGLLGALGVAFAFFIKSAIDTGAPGVQITDALRDAAGDKVTGEDGPGLLASYVTYMHDKAALSGLQTLFEIVGWIGLGLLLLFLYDAAKARRPQVPAWARSLLLTAIAASVLGAILIRVGLVASYSDFVSGADRSSQAARDAQITSLGQVGGWIGLFGLFGMVVSWIIVSLNAMRVGLLTRFLGMLGIFGGILLVMQMLPVLEIFWLIATSLVVLNKSLGPPPPAWQTGKAEPWPTKQEAAEARERARQGGKPAKSAPKAAAASPATSARKRKRRS